MTVVRKIFRPHTGRHSAVPAGPSASSRASARALHRAVASAPTQASRQELLVLAGLGDR